MFSLLVSFVVANQAPTAPSWEVVSWKDTDVSVELPGKPKPLKVLSQKGDDRIRVYLCKYAGANFVAETVVPLEPIERNEEIAALDAYAQTVGDFGKTTLVDKKSITLGGHPGRELMREGPSLVGNGKVVTRIRLYLIGENFYILTVRSAPDKSLPPEADRFFDSLSIRGVKTKAEADPKVATKSPKDTFREFMIAMVAKDEKTLRAVTVPNNDFDWLLKGAAPPANQLEGIKAQMMKTPIKTLKAGDTFALPQKRTGMIRTDEVSEDRAVILPDLPVDTPFPVRLRKIDGIWRVDAAPMIAGRKAADAARKKKEGK